MRELWWAARERKRFDGEKLGILLSWIALKFTGEKISAEALNPYRERAGALPAKSPEQLERESKAAWALLDRFFGGK